MIAQLFANLESADGVADLVYNSLLPRSEEQQRLIYFGGLFELYLVIWRIFSCMRLHPRVGLFVNTLSFSKSELLHYLVSFSSLRRTCYYRRFNVQQQGRGLYDRQRELLRALHDPVG